MYNSFQLGFMAAIGAIGGAIASAFGGWDASANMLLLCMAADCITANVNAFVFHNSDKTEGGALDSKVGWKGICRKGITLLIVLIAAQLDKVTGVSFARDAITIGFISYEVLSITENAAQMGVPIDPRIMKGIEVLKDKAEKK